MNWWKSRPDFEEVNDKGGGEPGDGGTAKVEAPKPEIPAELQRKIDAYDEMDKVAKNIGADDPVSYMNWLEQEKANELIEGEPPKEPAQAPKEPPPVKPPDPPANEPPAPRRPDPLVVKSIMESQYATYRLDNQGGTVIPRTDLESFMKGPNHGHIMAVARSKHSGNVWAAAAEVKNFFAAEDKTPDAKADKEAASAAAETADIRTGQQPAPKTAEETEELNTKIADSIIPDDPEYVYPG